GRALGAPAASPAGPEPEPRAPGVAGRTPGHGRAARAGAPSRALAPPGCRAPPARRAGAEAAPRGRGAGRAGAPAGERVARQGAGARLRAGGGRRPARHPRRRGGAGRPADPDLRRRPGAGEGRGQRAAEAESPAQGRRAGESAVIWCLRLLLLLLPLPAFAVDFTLEGKLEQGALLHGQTLPGAAVMLEEELVPVAADGRFLIGLDRDAPAR